MKNRIIFTLPLLIVFALSTNSAHAAGKPEAKVNAVSIADNLMKLCPDTILYKTELKSRKWNYEQGLMLFAFHQMYQKTKDKKYFDYIVRNLDYYVTPDGKIKTYKAEEYNIDNITPGCALLFIYKETGEKKYLDAAELLRGQLSSHPRNQYGGFWHKKIYPEQMWLDGLYMGEPFYAMYSSLKGDTAAYNDIALQFQLINDHARDKKTGLYYHAWDAARKQKWADSVTGTSPNFWGRSMGWFMMSLVEVLDYLPAEHPKRHMLINQLKSLSASLLKVRDKKTGLWFQVPDKPKAKGNYIEASASMMYIYSYAKAARKGYIDKKYLTAAKNAFNSALENLVSIDKDGVISLNNVCSVAGLGGTPYRDGSVEYYVGEPKRVNDFKGYGPFMLAAIELEKK